LLSGHYRCRGNNGGNRNRGAAVCEGTHVAHYTTQGQAGQARDVVQAGGAGQAA
jgi:hypothetical protein